MLPKAGDKPENCLLPSMAHEPGRSLFFSLLGHQLHKAAHKLASGWADEPMSCMVQIQGLSLQCLSKVWTLREPGQLNRETNGKPTEMLKGGNI